MENRRSFSGYLGGLASAMLTGAALASAPMVSHPTPARKRPNGRVERQDVKIGTGAMPVPGGGARERERERARRLARIQAQADDAAGPALGESAAGPL